VDPGQNRKRVTSRRWRRASSIIAFLAVAVIFLMPIGTDVELDKKVVVDSRVIVHDRREYWSIGTVFVLDPLIGVTRMNAQAIALGIGLALSAGLATYVALWLKEAG
jgi:hypothetical protein